MNNIRSILLLTFAMALFAVQDLFIKRQTVDLPPGQVIFYLGLGGALYFLLVALRRRQALFPPVKGNTVLYSRTAIEGICAFFIIWSLSQVPLATFATMFQAVPLVVTMGAALFLGETVGWRRWSAVLVGFLGVLLIIRPSSASFDWASLLVLGAVLAISTRDVISRRLPDQITTTTVSFQGFAALILAGPALCLLLQQPLQPMSWVQSRDMAAIILTGIVGYRAMITAFRIGDVSGLAPFRYTRMVFALALALIFLGERPDALTYVGAALIIASGLYSFLRERHLQRKFARNATS